MTLLGVQLPSQPITFRVKSRDEGTKVKEIQGWLLVFWLEHGGKGDGIYEGQKTGEGGDSGGDGGLRQAEICRSENQGESGAAESLMCGMG